MPTDTLPLLPNSEPLASSTVKCAICLSFLTPDNPAVGAAAVGGGDGTGAAGVQDGVSSTGGGGEGTQRFAPVGVTLSEEAERRQWGERVRNEAATVGGGEVDGEGRLCRTCAERSGRSVSISTATTTVGTGDVEVDDTTIGMARTSVDGERETDESADSRMTVENSITEAEAERVVEDEVMAVGDAVGGEEAGDEAIKTSPATNISSNIILTATTTTILPSSSRSVKGSARSALHTHAVTTRPPAAQPTYPREILPNPLLDIARLRVPSRGRGVLAPGAVFRGTQTSGRSSYEVEVRIVDISFPLSTLSGYLSISHLTDTHPQLTTFFSGEIIGPNYGFLTGSRYYAQATEQDDMRHWSRFAHFRKVKNELRRPGLTMKEPSHGLGKERSFCFMRWKERFLVPDHRVRDISGASFAGFYYIQVDMDPPPTSNYARHSQSSASTTTIMTSPVNTPPPLPRTSSRESRSGPTRPTTAARLSSNSGSMPGLAANQPRQTLGSTLGSPTQPRTRSPATAGTTRRSSTQDVREQSLPVLTGYYFHHQNSEPFQELSLKYVPQRGSGTFELR